MLKMRYFSITRSCVDITDKHGPLGSRPPTELPNTFESDEYFPLIQIHMSLSDIIQLAEDIKPVK